MQSRLPTIRSSWCRLLEIAVTLTYIMEEFFGVTFHLTDCVEFLSLTIGVEGVGLQNVTLHYTFIAV